MAAEWKNIGLPRWYDCKLGRLRDPDLARMVGTTTAVIRYRRMLFGIPVCTVRHLLEPFQSRLGVDSDRTIGLMCGVSAASVKTYRKSLGIGPVAKPEPIPRRPLMPLGHPLRPYKALIGLVADDELAEVAGLAVVIVQQICEALALPAAAAAPDTQSTHRLPNYPGPWQGFEALFGSMSSAKISRAVDVPYKVVEARRIFLGVPVYVRPSRIDRYRHLLGKVPNNVLAKFVGLSPARLYHLRSQVQGDGQTGHAGTAGISPL